MATLNPLLAKILIQVGADEPKEIGTIEIPIEISVPTMAPGKTNITVNIPRRAESQHNRIRSSEANQLPFRHLARLH